MPEYGLDRWRWVNDTGKNVSVYVAGELVSHANAGGRAAFDARPDTRFEIYERYGALPEGGYGKSEVPIQYGRVADFCQRI